MFGIVAREGTLSGFLAFWRQIADRYKGQPSDVVFKDIRAVGKEPRLEFTGFSETNAIENVTLTYVVINGKPLKQEQIKSNAFVRSVKVLP